MDKILPLLNNCDELIRKLKCYKSVYPYNNEIDEKIDILESAVFYLNKYKYHPLFNIEVVYQKYRIKYSKIYFKTSKYYCGNSYIEYSVNNTKSDFGFRFILLLFFKNYYKNG